MSYLDELEPVTIREAFSRLTVDDLKPLAAMVGQGQLPTRKGELVDLLARGLEDGKKVRDMYDGLDEVAQKAVQEAAHDPEGVLHGPSFRAKYGRTPDFGGSGGRYTRDRQPTTLRLFFPQRAALPVDLRKMLLTFVPEPPPLTVNACDDLPSRIRRGRVGPGSYRRKPDDEDQEVELRVRQTARAALHDVKAVLRLIDAGEVKVGEKTRRPSQGAMKAINGVLAEGDFYGDEDPSEDEWDPSSDLRMQPFAWPMLLQAAGLAEAAGTRLQLTAAGRKATARPAHEVIRQVWGKWQKTTLVDELSRVNVIKGQQAKGRGLTAVAPRRQAVVEVLEECPAQKWIAVDELFRLIKVLAEDFQVTHEPRKLYIADQEYGSLGYDSASAWETLQGRYALAFLFEYAATLGLLDVAYLPPQGARRDFGDRWGTDELSCLSRYDGLMYLRINALGAWCLGLAEGYEPEAVPIEVLLKVLPNRDVVAFDRPLGAADVLFLERFAERKSEAVWHLEPGKILEAVEKGMTVQELREFLAARSQPPLPQTVEVFLDDLASKSGQLEDLGAARLISCRDANVAQLLAHDRKLRNLCQLAGERHLVFRAADETTVRRALRELGYVMSPPR
jgi:hypothetical protein